MNQKGFIFTVTALHYVALFLLFLGLFLFIANKSVMVDSAGSLYSRTMFKFYNNAPNETIVDNGWCSVHMRYDPTSNFNNQSLLIINRYCENYAK